jgi:hypothetical protein
MIEVDGNRIFTCHELEMYKFKAKLGHKTIF